MSGNFNNQERTDNSIQELPQQQIVDNLLSDSISVGAMLQVIRSNIMPLQSARLDVPRPSPSRGFRLSGARIDFVRSDSLTTSEQNSRRNVSTSGQRRRNLRTESGTATPNFHTTTTSANRGPSQENNGFDPREARESQGRGPTTSSPRRIPSQNSRAANRRSPHSLPRDRNSAVNTNPTSGVPSGEPRYEVLDDSVGEDTNIGVPLTALQSRSNRGALRVQKQPKGATSYRKLHEKHPDLLRRLLKSIGFPKKAENSQGLLGYPSSTMRELVVENILHDVGGTVPKLQQALEDGIEDTVQHVLREVVGLSPGRDGSEEEIEPEPEPSPEVDPADLDEDDESVEEVPGQGSPRLSDLEIFRNGTQSLFNFISQNRAGHSREPRSIFAHGLELRQLGIPLERRLDSEEPENSSQTQEIPSDQNEDHPDARNHHRHSEVPRNFSFRGGPIDPDLDEGSAFFEISERTGLAFRSEQGMIRLQVNPTERPGSDNQDTSTSESSEVNRWQQESRSGQTRFQRRLHDNLAFNPNPALFFGEIRAQVNNVQSERAEGRRRLQVPAGSLETGENSQVGAQLRAELEASLEQITRQSLNRARQMENYRILQPRQTLGSGNGNPGASRNIPINNWAGLLIVNEPVLSEQQAGLSKDQMNQVRKLKMVKSKKNCSVCLCGFKQGVIVRQLPCKHIYHNACIKDWLKMRLTCPSCRDNVLAHISSQSDEYRAF